MATRRNWAAVVAGIARAIDEERQAGDQAHEWAHRRHLAEIGARERTPEWEEADRQASGWFGEWGRRCVLTNWAVQQAGGTLESHYERPEPLPAPTRAAG
jgi:hypothetical protein